MNENEALNPQHVAIIMDGNGRWALSRNKERIEGHEAGVKALQKIIESCLENDIKILTLFAFSSENWDRPQSEVDFLFSLFGEMLNTYVGQMHEEGICFRVLGDRATFNPDLLESILKAETLTKSNEKLKVNLAINYGGQWDIIQATKKIASQVAANELTPSMITSERFALEMSLGEMPSPDLLIRTSGELRISNFLLWHLAYTELFFTDVLWPDFNGSHFIDALNSYKGRKRRYGGLMSAN